MNTQFKKTIIATLVASFAASTFAADIRTGTSGNVSKLVNGKEVVIAETFTKGEMPKTPEQLAELFPNSYSPFKVDIKSLSNIKDGDSFVFDVNNQKVKVSEIKKQEHSSGDVSYVGRVSADRTAVLTTSPDGIVIGSIDTDDGNYSIEYHDGSSWAVDVDRSGREVQPFTESDEVADHKHGVDLHAMTKQLESQLADKFIAEAALMTPVASTIDVFIYYSNLMTNPTTRINNLVTKMNTAHVDSLTGITIRVVGMKAVTDKNPTSNTNALNSLTNAFGEFADAKAVRTSNGADLVMFIHPFKYAQGNCGVAWLNGSSGTTMTASKGFSVVSDGVDGNYYCSDYTMAHELAHNMGMTHNKENASGYGNYVDSFGYRVANVFGDIMSYERNVVGKFSSPEFKYNNYPMGIVGKADVQRGLVLNGPKVANFVAATK